MASNKDKIRAAAQKYLQKGQIDKAIKEFQRLVEDDPKDVRTLLKIGDLQTRKGDHADATNTYRQVAEFYSSQGFFLKAVAVYKQILKLDSKQVEVNLQLAELYQQLGLLSDAANQYRATYQIYEEEGRSEEGFAILQKMIELDPENIATRVKLAEAYAAQGKLQEACSGFRGAAAVLKSQRRLDDYVKVAERLVHLDPSDVAVSRELAQYYVQRGDSKRALAKLQLCYRKDPKDLETLELMANAFRDLGQLPKTVSVYREMARIYEAQGDEAKRLAAFRHILQYAPDDPEAHAAVEAKTKAAAAPSVASGSETAEAATPPGTQSAVARINIEKRQVGVPRDIQEVNRPSQAQSDDTVEAPEATEVPPPLASAEVDKLLVEVDIYTKYGLRKKALEHLEKVLVADPSHRDAAIKRKDLLIEGDETTEAVHALWDMVKRAHADGVTDQAKADLEELLRLDADHAEARALLEQLGGGTSTQPVGGAPAIEITIDEDTADDDAVDVLPEVLVEEDADDSILHGETASEFTAQFDVQDADDLGDLALEGDEGTDDEAVLEPAVELDVEPEVPPVSETVESTVEVVGSSEEHDLPDTADDDLDLDLEPSTRDEVEPVSALPSPSLIASSPRSGVASISTAAQPQPPTAPEPAPKKERPAKTPGLDPELEALIASAVPTRRASATTKPAARVSSPARESELEPVHAVREPEPEQAPAQEGSAATTAIAEAHEATTSPPIADDTEEVSVARPSRVLSDVDGSNEFESERTQVETAADVQRDLGFADDHEASSKGPLAAGTAVDDTAVGAVVASEPPSVPGQSRPEDPGPWISTSSSDELSARSEPSGSPPVAEPDLSAEVEEVRFYMQQGLDDEARDLLANLSKQHPGHSAIAAIADELSCTGVEVVDEPLLAPPVAPAPEPLDDFESEISVQSVDLAADIAEELQGEMLDDDDQLSLAAVFDEFKRGVAEQVEDSDFETHYNLGIAYREMGLVDDAIREFNLASNAPDREISALTMVGICELERGNATLALASFQKGLNSQNVTPNEAVALRYEIGAAYETQGRAAEAMRFFEKAHSMDAEFRDVERRLAHLRTSAPHQDGEVSTELDDLLRETQAEQEALRRHKSDKISYI